jgi:CBS domain-containing protein
MSSVEDYMNTKMVMRDSKASVLELAKVMVDWGVSSVAITADEEDQNNNNNKKVIGILTERDIVKSIAKGVPPDGGGSGSITAGSIMSSPILSIRKGQPIEEAALLMIRNKVRHLLVEDPDARNVVIGIISTTDLARYLKKRMKQATITTSSAVAREDEGKKEKEQQQQQQPLPQRESSSEVLLSEAWELYF